LLGCEGASKALILWLQTL